MFCVPEILHTISTHNDVLGAGYFDPHWQWLPTIDISKVRCNHLEYRSLFLPAPVERHAPGHSDCGGLSIVSPSTQSHHPALRHRRNITLHQILCFNRRAANAKNKQHSLSSSGSCIVQLWGKVPVCRFRFSLSFP